MFYLNFGTLAQIQGNILTSKQIGSITKVIPQIKRSGEVVQPFDRVIYRPDDSFFFSPLRKKCGLGLRYGIKPTACIGRIHLTSSEICARVAIKKLVRNRISSLFQGYRRNTYSKPRLLSKIKQPPVYSKSLLTIPCRDRTLIKQLGAVEDGSSVVFSSKFFPPIKLWSKIDRPLNLNWDQVFVPIRFDYRTELSGLTVGESRLHYTEDQSCNPSLTSFFAYRQPGIQALLFNWPVPRLAAGFQLVSQLHCTQFLFSAREKKSFSINCGSLDLNRQKTYLLQTPKITYYRSKKNSYNYVGMAKKIMVQTWCMSTSPSRKVKLDYYKKDFFNLMTLPSNFVKTEQSSYPTKLCKNREPHELSFLYGVERCFFYGFFRRLSQNRKKKRHQLIFLGSHITCQYRVGSVISIRLHTKKKYTLNFWRNRVNRKGFIPCVLFRGRFKGLKVNPYLHFSLTPWSFLCYRQKSEGLWYKNAVDPSRKCSLNHRLGSIIVTGDQFYSVNGSAKLKIGGHLTHVGRHVHLLRKIDTHLIPRNAMGHKPEVLLRLPKNGCYIINEYESLFSIPYKQTDRASDISAGIPRIESLFESKIPKDICGYPLRVFATTYVCRLWTAFFYSGIFSPFFGLSKSLEIVQQNLVMQIHGAYVSQSVAMTHLHIEIIVKQLTTNIIPLWDYDQAMVSVKGNSQLYELRNAIPLHTNIREKFYKPLSYAWKFEVLGLTKKGLRASSFLSIMSFQEVRRSLHLGGVKGIRDPFSGLKGALIVGENITLGTTMELQKLTIS